MTLPQKIFCFCFAGACFLIQHPVNADTNTDEASIDYRYNGHIKYQPLVTRYPDNSFFTLYSDKPALDNNVDTRLNFSMQKSRWSFNIDYQLLIRTGDTVEMYNQLPYIGTLPPITPRDANRVMDLTHIITNQDKQIAAHRLDRLHFNYTDDQNVIRLGRQAVSWGNGLIYNPMDFFNPFDPTAIDKEYKTGDDLLYTQRLFNNGSDLQTVWVGRRNSQGHTNHDVASYAFKYHAFVEENEIDLLAAQHFEDLILGIGAGVNIGGAVMRGDIVLTKLDRNKETIISSVLNLSYSWVLWDKNFSGLIEYYHNGFGLNGGNYAPSTLANKPELIDRLQRGELFTLGQDYLAASITIELKPLWIITPNIFWNVNDSSTMYQLVSQHDLKQNLQFLAAINIPIGEDNTEFGGIQSNIAGRPLSIEASLFAQLAWYF